MLTRFAGRIREIEGQTLTDYGLVLALIAVVCAGVITLFGESIEASIRRIAAGF
ncbi:MAG: Flp family type IVb pilin [Gemmatimonadota bacterium]